MAESRPVPTYRPVSEGSSWPGERFPSHGDVEIANESLEPDFLATFKRALLASSAAQNNDGLMHTQLHNAKHATGGFTYPLSILYNFPELPSDDDIDSLLQSFPRRFANEVFINMLPIPQLTQQAMAPFFRLSLACLACASTPDCAVSPERRNLARTLFFAGNSLWNVMLEVDNTEARTLEGALSPMLLSMYGALSADLDVWSLVEHRMLAPSSTIARRLRFQETNGTDRTTTLQPLHASTRSNVMIFLLLVSVLTALHMDTPMYVTSNELGIHSEPSTNHFHQAYTNLLNEDALLDRMRTAHIDPSILLIMILSDSISISRSLGKLLDNSSSDRQKPTSFSFNGKLLRIPHVPLSAASEYERMVDQLSCTLDRWMERFGSGEGTKSLALYFFCRLYLSCPDVLALPKLAAYPPAVQTSPASRVVKSVDDIPISNETIRYAWTILDNVDLDSGGGETTHPTWYPIVVFLAGLVVWASTQQSKVPWNRMSSPMQLIAFKAQLDRMPWPCCREMASTLHQLVRYR